MVCTRSDELVGRDAALEGDALDADPLEAAHQLAVGLAAARNRQIADDDVVPDDADGERGLVGEQLGARFAQRAERARHQRVTGRVELRATNGRGQATDEVVGHAQLAGSVHQAVPPAGRDRRGKLNGFGRGLADAARPGRAGLFQNGVARRGRRGVERSRRGGAQAGGAERAPTIPRGRARL